MTTVVCHNCHRENSVGSGFCQFCGSRLALPSTEPDVVEPDEARRLQEVLHGGERTIASLKQELETAKQELVARQEKLKALKQKAIADTLRDHEERLAEEARLRDRLDESEKNATALRLELEAAKSQFASSQGQLKEHMAAGQQAIEAVKRDLDLAREKAAAELNARLATGEQIIASLNKQHASALTQAAAAHQAKIALRDASIEELKTKLQDFAEREKQQLAAGLASLSKEPSQPGTTNRRSFGAVAMTVAAVLLAGAGGVGGFFLHDHDGSSLSNDRAAIKDLRAKLAETGKVNRDLEEELRSQHEAYQRVNEDLKRAEDQLKIQTSANPGTGANDDLQRELTETRGAVQQLQQKLTATEAELLQRKQDVTMRGQTIEQLKGQLREAKAQEATSHDKESRDTKEMRPKPRQSIDLNATIRNLEREYGFPRIGR